MAIPLLKSCSPLLAGEIDRDVRDFLQRDDPGPCPHFSNAPLLQTRAKTRGGKSRLMNLSSSRHHRTEWSGSFGVVMMDAPTPHLEQTVQARGWRPEYCHRVALVLQGGGAL